MLKLLTVALESDKLQAVIYTPTQTTIGIQLNHVPKGIIIDVSEIEGGGYCVKAFQQSPPAPGQQPQRPEIKVVQMVSNLPGLEEWQLCTAIVDKYFSHSDQLATADHFALLINGKNPTLSVAKDGK